MKVLQFTIPVAHDKSVIVEQVELPHYYPYLHRHKEAQITWVQKGEGTLIAGNNMHDFKPNDIFFIGANLPHLFKSNSEYFNPDSALTVKAFTVFFNPDGILAALFDLPEMRPFKIFLQQHQQGFSVPDQYFQPISHGLNQVKHATGAEQIMQFINLLKNMLSITTKLEPLSTYGDIPSITENEGVRIGNIYNYIMQNYSTAISLEDVAKSAYMTPESFCRYFKKHTGRTFISFLNEMRINEACKKLTAHKFESISAVAYKCGFKSIANFNRVFKFVTGVSPSEYLDSYAHNVSNLAKSAV
jgi:AraC-like DNA-binding protein/quercetin dioxygenase-like cupin family protein